MCSSHFFVFQKKNLFTKLQICSSQRVFYSFLYSSMCLTVFIRWTFMLLYISVWFDLIKLLLLAFVLHLNVGATSRSLFFRHHEIWVVQESAAKFFKHFNVLIFCLSPSFHAYSCQSRIDQKSSDLFCPHYFRIDDASLHFETCFYQPTDRT